MVVRALPGELRQRHGRDQGLAVDEAWEEHLYGMLGAGWPCPQAQQIDEIMADVGELLAARGLGYGRFTYGYYSDADKSLCPAAWCVTLHTRPEVVIETGVAHGVTSRILLEALRHNDRGQLWSIDLPFPFDPRLQPTRGWPSPMPAALAGHTWRARADSGCRTWWPRSVTWRCSSTTTCTRPGTPCSRWSRRPRPCRQVG